ncbi:fumarate reductase/succinate dehydrogenase flavoprotein domain protein (plasmid) [Azospirillum sp. B510]|uniref:FAD-binding protein n=1 Tax=Azospirillum sp. (strain B510) TaxID=137722 RepID=UPI0001C4CB18|nr:FAD-binding protein [Azospirillum sp. B510]BAI74807.1 fumarate reductase/succinate dehydrogenase flavoprotein domain protein [Azospirillum sp. B510]
MAQWDETYDFVIVGGGGGGICAALAAQDRGLRPLIIEKCDKVGGSTALSGGVLWIPDNPLMKRAGRVDSYEKARQHLEAVLGPPTQGSSDARRTTFLRTGPQVVSYLESKGMKFHLARKWPDYYSDRPGGEQVSRSLLAKPFDLRSLGEWKDRLNIYEPFDLPMHPDDLTDLMLIKRTWAGRRALLRTIWRGLRDMLTGKRVRGLGHALQGRMLEIALRNRVPLWRNAPVEDLIVEDGQVVGVSVRRDGHPVCVRALNGVLLASGGFAHNLEMRNRYQRQPVSNRWTNANVGDTGEVLQAAMRLGAATENLDMAIWVPTALMPNGDPAPDTVRNGKIIPLMTTLDMSKPSCIMVNAKGNRFVNESCSYMEIGEAMYSQGNLPCWYILDQTNRDRYMWGTKFGVPKKWLKTGFIKRAETLEELAALTGIDAIGLKATVERFNGFCASGTDQDFNRGGREYDRWNGDPSNRPNPSLGPIATPPFYAIAAFPGDVGTCGGLVCDEHARVLREDGSIIPRLYATGNCTSSVTGRFYPGAGASISSAFIFGYIAALHAAGGRSARPFPDDSCVAR